MGNERESVSQGDGGDHGVVGPDEFSPVGKVSTDSAIVLHAGVVEWYGEETLTQQGQQAEVIRQPCRRTVESAEVQFAQHHRTEPDVVGVGLSYLLDQRGIFSP